MNNRLLSIIHHKTGGKQSEFAALLGWTPHCLNNGKDFYKCGRMN